MIKRFTRYFIIIFGLIMILTVSALGVEFSKLKKSITEYTLKNGLKMIVMERHDAPVVSFVTWANVGSVDDPKGYTGIAHMFEHMAFKGTTTLGTKNIKEELKSIAVEDSIFMKLRSERNKGRLADTAKIKKLTEEYENAREEAYKYVIPNEFGRIVEREGGVNLNAFTTNDQTAFFYSLPSNKVELWMSLESERFLNPVLREMYKERDVVAEERRMRVDSSPFGRLMEDFLCIAYKAHPYGIPGIGFMSDIQNYSRKEAKDFFQKYYSPANLIVGIVGDVNPKEIYELAEKYWERIPYRPAPERISTIEPKQLGERETILEGSSQPIYFVGWHIPEITNPDRPALSALVDYLGQGRTSMLYRKLVKEKRIAIRVGAFDGFPGNKYPGLLAIYTMPSAGHTNEECETEIFDQVEKLKSSKITKEDMEKIKARAKASFINNLEGNLGMAMQLCSYQQLWGDWRELFKELDRINAVTPEDIQRVAQKYLTKNNRTIAKLNNIAN